MSTSVRRAEPVVHGPGADGLPSAGDMASQSLLLGLAHDFRQALTVVSGMAQLIETRRGGDAKIPLDSLSGALADTRSAAGRMAQLIDELEDFAMAQADQAPTLEHGAVDLIVIAVDSVARHARRSDHHTFSVTAPNAGGSAIVEHWDARKLERVIDNLVGNAMKFSPNGGNITIRVAREGALASDGIDAEFAVMEVRDEGVGIPADDLPHVFEWFRRAANAVGLIPGTGMGLAVVKELVQQHGGTVEATSEPGCGSTLTVRLPLARGVSANGSAATPRAADMPVLGRINRDLDAARGGTTWTA